MLMSIDLNNKVFVDSNFFVALFNPNDSQYAKALKLSKYIDRENLQIIITNYIFLEVVTVLSQKRGKIVGNKVGEYLTTVNNIVTVHVDEELQRLTWQTFKTLENKDISFVDCSSAMVMKSEGISKLITFDTNHFKKLQKLHRFGFVE